MAEYNPEMEPIYTGEQPGSIRKFLGELLGIDPGVDRYEDVFAEGVPSYDIASGDARPIGRRAIRYGDAPVTEPVAPEAAPDEFMFGNAAGTVDAGPTPDASLYGGDLSNLDWSRGGNEGVVSNADANRINEANIPDDDVQDMTLNLEESDIADVSGDLPVNKYPPGTLMHWLNSASETDPNAASGRLGALKRQQAIVPDVSQMTESVGGRRQPPPAQASVQASPPIRPPSANPRANVAGGVDSQNVPPTSGPDLKGRGGRGRQPEPDITGAEVDPMNLMDQLDQTLSTPVPPMASMPATPGQSLPMTATPLPMTPVNPRANIAAGAGADAGAGGGIRFRGQPQQPGSSPISPNVYPPVQPPSNRAAAINASIGGGGPQGGGVGGRGQAGGNAAQQGAFNLMNVIRSIMPKGAPPPSLDRPPMEGPLVAEPEPDWIRNRSRGLLN